MQCCYNHPNSQKPPLRRLGRTNVAAVLYKACCTSCLHVFLHMQVHMQEHLNLNSTPEDAGWHHKTYTNPSIRTPTSSSKTPENGVCPATRQTKQRSCQVIPISKATQARGLRPNNCRTVHTLQLHTDCSLSTQQLDLRAAKAKAPASLDAHSCCCPEKPPSVQRLNSNSTQQHEQGCLARDAFTIAARSYPAY